MNSFCRRIAFLFLLLNCATIAIAQPLTYKMILQNLQSIQKQFVPDKRVAILDVGLKDTLQSVVVLSGETNLADAKQHLLQFLTENKISFVDSMRLLPDSSLGEKTWALVTLSVSNLRAKPDDTSELVSQLTMGTPLKVLDINNKWYRVQTPEYYIGWMELPGLQLFTETEMNRWKKSNRYLFNHLSGYAVDSPNKKGAVVSDLVLDDLFEVESTVKGYLKIIFPDGRTGYVRKTDCISFEDWINSEPNIASVIEAAKQMMGFPYLWGGTSSKAVDCSGFTKLAFYSQGIILARDASQQARYGEPVDISNRTNLEAGDLLFFGRSALRITHVGIYLGNGNFIHASGKVHISSIDPNDPKFVATRNLVAARRIMNSLKTEGIVKVKDHTWY